MTLILFQEPCIYILKVTYMENHRTLNLFVCYRSERGKSKVRSPAEGPDVRRNARLRANAWRHLSPPHLQSADGFAADHPLPSARSRLLEQRETKQPHRPKQTSQRDDRLCYGLAAVIVPVVDNVVEVLQVTMALFDYFACRGFTSRRFGYTVIRVSLDMLLNFCVGPVAGTFEVMCT